MNSAFELLLIDDQPDDRDLICHLLSSRMDGINITCEHDREKVKQLIRDKRFDLIITDYYLGDYNGLELVDEIRSMKGFDIPIILITGEDSKEFSLEAIQHGVDDFVIKTLKGIKELPTIIQRTLKRAEIHKLKQSADNRSLDETVSFQNIFDNAPELIFTLWPDATFVNANDATLKTLNITRKDTTTRNFVEFIDNAQRGIFKAAMNRIISNKTSVSIDLLIYAPDSTKHNISGTGNPHIVNERVVATNWIFRNVTTGKYMESLLWDDYRQYSGIFDTMPAGVLISDHRGKILQVNSAVCDLLGYRKEELKGKKIEDITHPDEIKLSIEQHRKLMSGELNSYTIEKRYRNKQGEYIWVELSGSRINNMQGDPLYAIAYVKEISELKQFENLLGKLAHDLTKIRGEYLYDHLSKRLVELLQSDYLFFVTSDDNYIFRGTLKTIMFRDKENVLDNVNIQFSNELVNELTMEDELCISNRITRKGKVITAFDEFHAVDTYAIPLRNKSGNIIGILGVIYTHDNTNRSMIISLLRIAGLKIGEQLEESMKADTETEIPEHDHSGNYSIN